MSSWLRRHGSLIFLMAWMLVIGAAVLIHSTMQDEATRQALCPAFELITARPVPYPSDPAKNPSRLQAWQFYEDFVTAEHQYRCS